MGGEKGIVGWLICFKVCSGLTVWVQTLPSLASSPWDISLALSQEVF